MVRLFLFALIGLSINTSSLAQEEAPAIESADEMLERCLSNSNVEACSGVWVEHCLKDALTTVDILGCYAPELDFWEAQLSSELGELDQLFTEQDEFEEPIRALAPRLKTYQEQWLAWRATKCGFEYEKFRGGSMGRITHADCQLSETANRVAEIRSLREDAGFN